MYLIHRRDSFRGDIELVNKLKGLDNVEIVTPATIETLIGNDVLTGVRLSDGRFIAVDGIFIAVGQTPENDSFTNVIELDEGGYASSAEDCATKTKGVFVAGDCRVKTVRQLTTAVADGATAATHACEYLDSLR